MPLCVCVCEIPFLCRFAFPLSPSDRHRSFRLRLPSIRRDIRSRGKSDGSRSQPRQPQSLLLQQQQQQQDPENPPVSDDNSSLKKLDEVSGGEGGAAFSPSCRLPPTHACIKEEEEEEDEEEADTDGFLRGGREDVEGTSEEKAELKELMLFHDGSDLSRGQPDGVGVTGDVSARNVDNEELGKTFNN